MANTYTIEIWIRFFMSGRNGLHRASHWRSVRIVTDYKEASDSPTWIRIQQKIVRDGVSQMLFNAITNMMFRQINGSWVERNERMNNN